MGNPQEPGCCVENLNLPSLSAPSPPLPPSPPPQLLNWLCVRSSVWLAGRWFNIPALKYTSEQLFFFFFAWQHSGYTDWLFWVRKESDLYTLLR